MISDQELLEFMREKAYKPMTYQELEQHFEIDNAEQFKALLQQLNRLEQDGEIVRTRTNRYGVPERMNLLRGTLQTHAKGFGFLLPDDTDHPDVYIHANDMKGAMNGDRLLVRVTGKKDLMRLEGEVVRILSRANTSVVGLWKDMGSFGFVVADDKRIVKDIFVPKEASQGAVDGHKVVVEIVKYPEERVAAEGKVVEILGHKNDPGVDILSIIRKYNLPEQFPDEVMREAESVPETIREEELAGRRDLRGETIVTIDGADAKDLDDAVQVKRLENGNYRLGVHIADVSYYVQEGSQLDREAYRRGCSVYLVDRVIPMLPQRLSNGICSLNPRVDRLTMSCEMEFDANGKLVKHDVFPSVIRTVERMTYEDVRKILVDEDEETIGKYRDRVEDFRTMQELALILRQRRMNRGAIDFDFPEAKVLVDEDGKPVEIRKQERSIAEQLIEEFMLAANETVAEHFFWMKVPFMYRIHEDPDSEKLIHFMEFITNFGYIVRGTGNKVHPRALQTLLEEIKGAKEETVISTMMLRSMKQAKYSADNLGHFGLAANYYAHFTSPIRRYPDLVIHRIMREILTSGGLSSDRHDELSERMEEMARQSSERERIAVDAERDTDNLKKAEYMLDKIGEEFEGIVSGVTSFGMFVELENTVEGMVHLSHLTDDYYHFHERQMALIGERTARIFRIGDEVKVRVRDVNMDEHAIDFELVDMKPRRKREAGDGKRKGEGDGATGGNGKGDSGKGRKGKGGGRKGSGSNGKSRRQESRADGDAPFSGMIRARRKKKKGSKKKKSKS